MDLAKRMLLVLLFLWIHGDLTVSGQTVAKNSLLSTLTTNHPRLFFSKQDEDGLRLQLEKEPALQKVHAAILSDCEALLTKEPVKHVKIGKRLLDKSRECLRRVFALSYAYRMTHKEVYLKRAEQELLAVANFKDWNPSHFLDVGEMSLAVAVGYDWLFNELSASTKKILIEALINKGINPSFDKRYNWFLDAEHNWNQVCNAGISCAALAIAEDEPVLAEKVVQRALQTIRKPMATYAPDGGYAEGFGYWEYGTSFNVIFLSALKTALGSDFGLTELPGFLRTAAFQEHMVGPTGWCHNWSDSGLKAGLSPAMFWFAQQNQDASLLWNEKQLLATSDAKQLVRDRLLPLLLVWGDSTDLEQVTPPKALQWVGQGHSPVALMRSSWTDPNALFVGFKAGSAEVNHAHMDAGSFVMDALGERWAMDFGPQDYNSLETSGVDLWNRAQNSQRWEVFRYNNKVHNTLTIDDQLQVVKGYSKIDRWSDGANNLFAISDLTDVYRNQAAQLRRGIAIKNKKYVLVRDEIQAPTHEITLRWTLLTAAQARILNDHEVLLSLHGKNLHLRFESNQSFTLKTWDTTPTHDYDAPNPGTIRVGFEATLSANEKAAFNVFLGADTSVLQPAEPLEQWTADGAGFDTVRERVVANLLRQPQNPAAIKNYMAKLQPDGRWPDINYTDTSRTGFEHGRHLERLRAMATAYEQNNGPYTHNTQLLEHFKRAYHHWIKAKYQCENWWWNEIGTPMAMTDILLIIGKQLSPEELRAGIEISKQANFHGVGARPGGDLIKMEGIMATIALLEYDQPTFASLVDSIASEIKTATGRGLQVDMSFHHRTDEVISTLSYGKQYASTFAYWATILAGTSYALPTGRIKLLTDYYIDGISQSMAFGRYPDLGAENRDITRRGALLPDRRSIAQELMKVSDYRKQELAHPKERSNRYFWHSHYFTHQRPDFFASVRMHSKRSNNMEYPYNGEGLRNHFYADGSQFITRTGQEYLDIFPVWDWLKIPGTTVVQLPSFPGEDELVKKGLNDFVGGVSDGQYGAAAFDFKSPHQPLHVRKAWFFFDDAVLSLGADIHSTAPFPVVTTLNQCLLKGRTVIANKKGIKEVTQGEHNIAESNWIWQDSVGYLFFTPTAVKLKNETATGNWKQINRQSWASNKPVSKPTFTLWIDHGKQPKQGQYAYLTLPAVSPADITDYAKKPSIHILANDAAIQAAWHKNNGISYVVFYEAGTLKWPDGLTLTVDKPCIVLLKKTGVEVKELAVSDPTALQRELNVQLNVKVTGQGEHWSASWNEQNGNSLVHVSLPQDAYAGQSVVMKPAV